MLSNLLISAFLLLVVASSGCSAFYGYPKDFIDINGNFKAQIKRDMESKKDDNGNTIGDSVIYNEYKQCLSAENMSPEDRKKTRNSIIAKLMTFIELQYNEFRAALYHESVLGPFAGDSSITALAAASTLAGAAGANAATMTLSALITGFNGIKTSYDKVVLFNLTMPAIISQMDTERAKQSDIIYANMNKEYNDYTLPQALSDINIFFRRGTLPGAINSLTQMVAAKAEKAAAEKANALDDKVANLKSTFNSLNLQLKTGVINALLVPGFLTLSKDQTSLLAAYKIDPAATPAFAPTNNETDNKSLDTNCIGIFQIILINCDDSRYVTVKAKIDEKVNAFTKKTS